MRRWSGVKWAAIEIYCSDSIAAAATASASRIFESPAAQGIPLVKSERYSGARSRSVRRHRSLARNTGSEYRKFPVGAVVLAVCELLVIVVTICLLMVVTLPAISYYLS
jgi:hypothetical protein